MRRGVLRGARTFRNWFESRDGLFAEMRVRERGVDVVVSVCKILKNWCDELEGGWSKDGLT